MNTEERNSRVLSYLRSRIGKATPRNRDIAEHIGMLMGIAEAAIYQLRTTGVITIRGGGNSRVIEIVGEGKTLARNNVHARDTLIPSNEPEPVRVENFTCPRCGARNCTSHSAAFLTTSATLPVWMGARA